MSAGQGVPQPAIVSVAAHAALTVGAHGMTAAGAALVDDADAAAQRATLGLVIGTNVQAQDAELQAIAGLISVADRLPYFTGSGTAALATFTAAGRALLDDADAAAQRTTLDVPGLNTANTLTGIQTIQVAATQDAIKLAGRAGGTSSFSLTITPLALSANRTLSAPDETGTIALRGANTFTGRQDIEYLCAYGPLAAFRNSGGIYFSYTSSAGYIGSYSDNTGTKSPFYLDGSAVIIGTDPGGTAILRVGGSARIKDNLVVDDNLYIGNSSSSSGVAFRFDGFSDRLFVISSPSATAGSSMSFRTGVAGGAETDRVIINDNGSVILGTDPGGSELLRVGGSVNIASGQGYKVAGTKVVGGQASAIADVSTADATDLASAIALANANKSKINTILAMLRTHGLIAT